jgi:hypothetical protein
LIRINKMGQSKIRLYVIIGFLLLVLGSSGFLLAKDEMQTKRLTNLVQSIYAKVKEATEKAGAPSGSQDIKNTIESSSTIKININYGESTSPNTKINTYQHDCIPPQVEVHTPYTETEEYKKWKEDFDKEWEEMQEYVELKQKEVEENQKKFCEEHSDLCD